MILEGAGAIQDRTAEHLGYTDKAIVAARQMLMKVAAGLDTNLLPMVSETSFDDIATIDTVTGHDDWRTGWIARQLKRRAASPWASRIPAAKLRN